MRDDDYRNTLIEAISLLQQTQSKLFTSMVNVGMFGEHKEIHGAFDVGDVYQFELSMFEQTNDPNLEQLVGLIKEVARCKQTLMNQNDISEEELDINL